MISRKYRFVGKVLNSTIGKIYYKKIKKRMYWNYEKLLKYQKKTLEIFIQNTINEFNYYKSYKIYSNFEDYPILTKKNIISNYKNFQNNKYNFFSYDVKTSGSSGTQFKFRRFYKDSYFESLYVLRNFDKYNYKLGERLGYLRSYIPENEKNIYEINSYGLWMSAYHMDNKNMMLFAKLINKLKIRFLLSYPSAFYIFSIFCNEKKITLPYIKAVFLSSEKLLQIWRKKIKKTFPNIEIIDRYGLAEFSNSLTYCEKCKGYHLNEDYGFTEFIHIKGDRYFIVGTGFLNNAFPMIRYNTGDIIRINCISDSSCEYGSKVVKGEIEGRQSDLLYIDGKYLPGVNFFTLFYHYDKQVKQFQIIQNDYKSILIKLVLNESFKMESFKKLLDNIEYDIRKRVGKKIKIYLQKVDKIKRDKYSGKVKIIKSLIKL